MNRKFLNLAAAQLHRVSCAATFINVKRGQGADFDFLITGIDVNIVLNVWRSGNLVTRCVKGLYDNAIIITDASKTLPSKSTLQKTLSAFSLEKFLTGDTAFIHSGISQSTSLTIVAPTADNALSTFTKRGESDFLVLTNKSGVQIGGSIFSERNQW